MELKIYLHRTKKKNFEVCDCFPVYIDLDKIPEDKATDVDFINAGLKNDAQKIAATRECVKKYGVAYLSFMRPQYEGPEEGNGNDKIYFDNNDMLFKLKKKPRAKKKKEDTNETSAK